MTTWEEQGVALESIRRLQGTRVAWEALCFAVAELGFYDEVFVLAAKVSSELEARRAFGRPHDDMESIAGAVRYQFRQLLIAAEHAASAHPSDARMNARAVTVAALINAEVLAWARADWDAKYHPESGVGPGTW